MTLAAASAVVVVVDGPEPVYPEVSAPHVTEMVIPSPAFAPVIVYVPDEGVFAATVNVLELSVVFVAVIGDPIATPVAEI